MQRVNWKWRHTREGIGFGIRYLIAVALVVAVGAFVGGDTDLVQPQDADQRS